MAYIRVHEYLINTNRMIYCRNAGNVTFVKLDGDDREVELAIGYEEFTVAVIQSEKDLYEVANLIELTHRVDNIYEGKRHDCPTI